MKKKNEAYQEGIKLFNENKDFIFGMYMDGIWGNKKGHAQIIIDEENNNEAMGGGFNEEVNTKSNKYFPLNKKSDINQDSKIRFWYTLKSVHIKEGIYFLVKYI